jgi:Mg2+/citrate symporter
VGINYLKSQQQFYNNQKLTLNVSATIAGAAAGFTFGISLAVAVGYNLLANEAESAAASAGVAALAVQKYGSAGLFVEIYKNTNGITTSFSAVGFTGGNCCG